MGRLRGSLVLPALAADCGCCVKKGCSDEHPFSLCHCQALDDAGQMQDALDEPDRWDDRDDAEDDAVVEAEQYTLEPGVGAGAADDEAEEESEDSEGSEEFHVAVLELDWVDGRSISRITSAFHVTSVQANLR